VEYFFVKFGDHSCIGFGDIAQSRRTDTQTNGSENGTLLLP